MASSNGDPGELPRHLLHLSTLQLVTRASPFTHARTLPLHTLSHLIQDYLGLLAQAAKDAAEHSGRDKVSIWDVGAALDEFGTGTLADLKDEVERGDEGVGEEAQRIRELAQGLKDVLHIRPPPTPVAQLCYDALLPTEILAINDLPDLVPEAASPGSDDSDDAEPRSPRPPAPVEEPIVIKHEESFGNLFLDSWDREMDVDMNRKEPIDEEEEEEDAGGRSAWRDPTLIPSYVLDFLPPFPGMEREVDVSSPVRRRREREREREAAQAEAWAAGAQRVSSATMGGDPWLAPIPYASSMLAEMHPITALPPLSPPPASPPPGSPSAEDNEHGAARSKRRRARSISPPPASTNSLAAYRETAPEVPHLPKWLRPNPKRREAAGAISLSSDLSLSSSDSLFGVLPVPETRQASRPPGFLPDFAPPRVHPFNTSLPYTISSPVPYHAAAGHLIAAPPHPRVPDALPRVKNWLSRPNSPSLALFSRLTRMGPPGPLGPKGEALDYEYVGTSAVVALNVEWPVRAHNARLPPAYIKEDVDGPSAAPTPQTGIKLKLGRGGSQSQAGSPAPTPGPSGSWGGSGVFGGAGGGEEHAMGREGSVSLGGTFYGSPSREMEVVQEEDVGASNGHGEAMLGVSRAGEASSARIFNESSLPEQAPPSAPRPFDFGGTTFTFKAQPSPPPAPPPPAPAPAPITFAASSFAYNPFEAPPPPPPPALAPPPSAPPADSAPPSFEVDSSILPESDFAILPDTEFASASPAPQPAPPLDFHAHPAPPTSDSLAPPPTSSFASTSPIPSPLPAHVLDDPIASQLSQMFSPEQILTPQGSPEATTAIAGFDFGSFGAAAVNGSQGDQSESQQGQ